MSKFTAAAQVIMNNRAQKQDGAALLESKKNVISGESLGISPEAANIIDGVNDQLEYQSSVDRRVAGSYQNVDKAVQSEIGQMQLSDTPRILQHAPDTAYDDPGLTREEEGQLLEEYAARRDIPIEDVAIDPVEYERFGRFLGARTNTLSDDKFFSYGITGSTGDGSRSPTPWVQPRFVQENTGAEIINTPEGPQVKTRNLLGDTIAETNINGLAERSGDRVHETLESVFKPIAPGKQEAFSERIAERTGFKPDDIQEFMYSLVNTYAATQEGHAGAGKMFSDVMLHSVLNHSLKNAWKDQENDSKSEVDKLKDSVLDADQETQSGIADDIHVGFSVLEGLKIDKPNKRMATMIGSIARNVVHHTFNSDLNSDLGLEYGQMFDTKEVPAMRDGIEVKTFKTSLTPLGVLVAEKLRPLTTELLPSSNKPVRTSLKVTTEHDAKARRTSGLDDYDQGNLDMQRRNLDVMNNTPTSIHKETLGLLATLKANPEAMKVLDGPKFLNIRGDGHGGKGSPGNRLEWTVARDDWGRTLHEADGSVKFSRNLGDFFKDRSFNSTLEWAGRNTEKPFFYDYFYATNLRMFIDQTEGNYQSNKLARALVSSGTPESYNLNSAEDITLLKGGIMKRFGHDKKGFASAAKEFDALMSLVRPMLGTLQGQGGVDLLKLAEKEGFASVTAIAEAVKLDKAITDMKTTGKNLYRSGFFLEVDGLTNGMAHSSMQAGDLKTALATGLYSLEQYADILEAGDMPMDVYNQLAVTVESQIEATQSPDLLNLLGMIRKHGGRLGRSFAKAPVMIFGYGAGPAMIALTAKAYIKDMFIANPGLLEAIEATDINLDAAGDKLGGIVAESLKNDFKLIRKFSNLLQTINQSAGEQGFAVRVPLASGAMLNLGTIDYQTDPTTRRKYSVGGVQYEGQLDQRPAKEFSSFEMKSTFNPLSQAPSKEDGRPVFKAATQAVMINHANDNINMTGAIASLHKKYSKGGVGNTSLHIFDGILVTPRRAKETTAKLNEVFLKLNKLDKGHLQRVMDGLVFEYNPNGFAELDPNAPVNAKDGHKYKRRLKEPGKTFAMERGISTWDRSLDQFAYRPTYKGKTKQGKPFTINLDTSMAKIESERFSARQHVNASLQFFL